MPWKPELVPIIPLSDAVSALQTLYGTTDPQMQLKIDLDQDGRLGLEETILYLQILADLKGQNRYNLTSKLHNLFPIQQHYLPSPQ